MTEGPPSYQVGGAGPGVERRVLDPELVSRLRLVLTRLARRLRQQGGTELSASQLSALAAVARRGPLSVGELAAVEQVRPPSATAVVDHLEGAGLVRRSEATADRRLVLVEATAEGEARLEHSRLRRDSWLARRLAGFGPKELEELERSLPLLERLLSDDP